MKPTACSLADSASNNRPPSSGDDTPGFTRIELLVVIATLAMLALTLLPALAKGRVKPQGTQCLSNLRQITMGWLMYADENNGNFPINLTGTPTLNWVNAHMDYTGGADDTNSAKLVNPAYSQLAPYVQNPAVYRCPADQSLQFGLTGLPRVRSYSMSEAIGIVNLNGTPRPEGPGVSWLNKLPALPNGHFTIYTRENQLQGGLGPADIWVLIDEDPDSINDGVFAVQMALHISQAKWVDLPAKLHNNACGISYGDGHSGIHRWQNGASIQTTTYLASLPEMPNGTPNSDCLWLDSHTTAPTRGF